MTAWLGVVSAEHARRGIGLGIVQIGHGKRAPLLRLHPGDGFVIYSPQERLGEPPRLRAFTAVGTVSESEVWQADEGDFKPFRRRMEWDASGVPVPLDDLRGDLRLTAQPNWGYQLRRGLIPLDDEDFAAVRAAMRPET
ncbi:EVE domain-containing protein [uncultured Amnibacterium sp.]|uniref:EVE domain-containing protein n=1 Tax=uncultured Amnibacterium sp. TaxID=1631851 RepID=UPI0035CABF5B